MSAKSAFFKEAPIIVGARNIVFGAAFLAAAAMVGCTPPLSPEGRKLLDSGREAYLSGDDEATVQRMGRFLAEHADVAETDEAHYWRGLARIRRKDAAGARADLTEALQRTRRADLAALASKALGDLAYDAGDMPTAERHYARAVADIPDGTSPQDEALYRYGQVLQRLGRWDDADLQFSRLVYRFEDGELARRAGRLIHCRAWTVQAAAMKDRARARQLSADLRRRGLSAFVQSYLVAGEVIHAVQVGLFEDHASAAGQLPRVRAVRKDAFVTVSRGRGP